jgi:hypothetical protein
MAKLQFHPATEGLPLMTLPERNELGLDLKKNGQRLPIVLLDGKIIDGRNRYLACIANKIEPNVLRLSVKDPKAYVASMNYFRRHWSTQERSHFGALLLLANENVDTGKLEKASDDAPTETTVARAMNVSRRSVQRSKAKIRGKTNEKKPVQDRNGSETILDNSGIAVPATALGFWSRKTEVNEIINAIHAIKRKIEVIPKEDPLYANVGLSGVVGDLKSAINRLTGAVPAHVCPYCKGAAATFKTVKGGTASENCKACRGMGVVSKYFWDTAVPKEMKPEQPF